MGLSERGFLLGIAPCNNAIGVATFELVGLILSLQDDGVCTSQRLKDFHQHGVFVYSIGLSMIVGSDCFLACQSLDLKAYIPNDPVKVQVESP